VAVAGLCVNLFGMYVFNGGHGHSHGGGGSEKHDHPSDCNDSTAAAHSHSHSHSHGHSHHGHSHGGNANMRGVFLHVLADTLGSVFVIISTLLIQIFGWQWVDPLCSLILSMLILCSVYPLLKSSASVLLQSIPEEMDHDYSEALDEILHVEGVQSHSQFHLWQLKSSVNVVSIHIRVADQANEHAIRQRVAQILKKIGGTHVTVQVEKEVFVNSRFNSSHNDGQNHSHSRKHRSDGQTNLKGVVARNGHALVSIG